MKLFNTFRKYQMIRTNLGFILIGAAFAVMGVFLLFKGEDDLSFPLIFMGVGGLALVFGIIGLIKAANKPADNYNQLNRVKEAEIDPELRQQVLDNDEEMQDYVFHFTGHLNQDFVMKDVHGETVFEALCEKVQLIKDTKYTFVHHITGESREKMISHTLTRTVTDESFRCSVPISSGFDIDGVNCWDYIADMGYGSDIGLQGIALRFTAKRYGIYVGEAIMAGTGAMNPKYADKPQGKIPTNGIFRIKCRPADIEGLFMLCFTLTRVELFGGTPN